MPVSLPPVQARIPPSGDRAHAERHDQRLDAVAVADPAVDRAERTPASTMTNTSAGQTASRACRVSSLIEDRAGDDEARDREVEATDDHDERLADGRETEQRGERRASSRTLGSGGEAAMRRRAVGEQDHEGDELAATGIRRCRRPTEATAALMPLTAFAAAAGDERGADDDADDQHRRRRRVAARSAERQGGQQRLQQVDVTGAEDRAQQAAATAPSDVPPSATAARAISVYWSRPASGVACTSAVSAIPPHGGEQPAEGVGDDARRGHVDAGARRQSRRFRRWRRAAGGRPSGRARTRRRPAMASRNSAPGTEPDLVAEVAGPVAGCGGFGGRADLEIDADEHEEPAQRRDHRLVAQHRHEDAVDRADRRADGQQQRDVDPRAAG